jgi:transposase
MKELYVRKLSKKERDYVYNLIEDKKYSYRGLIIALSYEGYPVGMIARKVNMHPVNVRKWIRRFNRLGIDGISPKKAGRKPKLDRKTEDKIVTIALTEPEELGLYFSTWSLRKLQEYLKSKRVAELSHSQLRKILMVRGLRFKRSRQRLISKDPEYEAKRRRIRRLLRRPNCRVLFEDEKRLVAKEYGGYKWCTKARLIGLNQRIKGKEVLFAAYDPHKREILRKYMPSMRKEYFVEFLKFLSRKSGEDVYLIIDNHPTHKSEGAKGVFKEGKIKPVWLPKHAPELNGVDKIVFSLLQREVLQNRNFTSLEEVESSVDEWIKQFNSCKMISSLQN